MRPASTNPGCTAPDLLAFNNDIVSQALNELSRRDHFRHHLSTIFIEYQDGRLIITGQLPSFYLKQVLQTVLRTLPEVKHVDNRVEVVPNKGLEGEQHDARRSDRP